MAHALRGAHLAPLALAVVLALLPTAAGAASADELTCGQEPGNRFFWIERAFCDLPSNGPERANGIVIWNHGIYRTLESWRAPAPPAFRLLQARGWDVIMLKRHNLAEVDNVLYRTVRRTLQEVAAARKQGYRKVVLAGQSFGGYVSLEAIDTSADIDAAVAFAPGSRASGATGRLDPGITDRILQRAKVGRLALVFPKDDDVFNHIVRGESAQAILSRRTLPYLLLDETSGLSGHGGGVSGRFALRYGLCLADFLAAPSLPAGRFTCPPVADDWPAVRELLLPAPEQRPVSCARMPRSGVRSRRSSDSGGRCSATRSSWWRPSRSVRGGCASCIARPGPSAASSTTRSPGPRPTAHARSTPGSSAVARAPESRPLEPHLFVRRREVEERVQTDGGLLYPRSHAVQRGRLEDRRVHHALVHQPLDLV
jgi:pimeloyl-ACP methyl ester carboxylesterase